MEATLIQSEPYISADTEELPAVVRQRKILTLLEPAPVNTSAWDPYEVWRRMIKEPRDRQLASRKD